ncbi:putative S-layer protein [Synechococcus sp. PCC 7502]|uniref:iron uptake porin n=1 Tax=Synechococcus sp. PCC 7502 TaxID=1173263 RepID=UPI00029FE49E|nr:iron uptake porin [Synechococcus sp. PCC 7502]AFY72411.1 putative S-layer protein [Synechococcus sp. PCC 7502]
MLKNYTTRFLILTSCLSIGVTSAVNAETRPEVSDSTPISSQSSSTTKSPSTVITQIKNDSGSKNISENVTSVSQLSDVQPTDWAFTSLQSLVERYGCIAGYPDKTYRGQRALSRYEFAAGLNACLDKVNELISSGLSDKVGKEDLATLRKLQEDFAAELTALRGRVDAVESKTAELEAQQFSTTTKLSGEVILGVAGATGANTKTGGTNTNIVFNNRVRLNLLTSFTGKDLLITGLQAYNLGGGASSLQGTLGYADGVGLSASNVRLGYEPQFPGTNVNGPLGNVVAANSVNLYKLLYIFPVASKFTMFAGTSAEVSDAFPAISPFASEGQGAISRFGQGYNAAYRVSGGTSGTGLASAVGFIWNPSDQVDFRALYGSINAALPNDLGVPGTPVGAGFFGGSTIISTQLTLKPTSNLDIGINYANSYHQINILGTGLAALDIGSIVGPGTSIINPIRLNSVGGTLTWRVTPKIAFNVSGAWIFANLTGVDASTTFTSWMAGFHFSDVFKEGNTAGIIFGQPLARSSVGGKAIIPVGFTATPYQLEGYFNFRLSKNISITPGVFFVFNPEGINNAPTATVGVVRTTFTF